MKPTVTPHARVGRRGDANGDPLDGLVNLFDLGIVLAVAFLLAALSSLRLSSLLTQKDLTVVQSSKGRQTLIVKRGDTVQSVTLSGRKVAGQGRKVGSVYRLSDGRLVVVRGR